MKTLKKVEIKPVWVEFIPDVLEENTLYISIPYSSAVHNCLCGCGNLAVTPFKRGEWFLTDVAGKVTLTPSILNTNCPIRSHYIITNNVANFV